MGLKEDFSFKDKGNRINPRCEGTGAFRDLQLVFFSFCNLFCLSAGACEMQPLPDRCVAPQLQPTESVSCLPAAYLLWLPVED